MANNPISAFTALAGASVATDDVYAIVDTSVTTTKKITAEENRIAMYSVPATQAQQETGTSAVVSVVPSVQHFHDSAVKAWGVITPATTVTTSYPAAGTSVTNPGTGQYVVTHGRTFSSSNYAISVIATESGVANPTIGVLVSQNATTFTVQFWSVGSARAPEKFTYQCCGDLA